MLKAIYITHHTDPDFSLCQLSREVQKDTARLQMDAANGGASHNHS